MSGSISSCGIYSISQRLKPVKASLILLTTSARELLLAATKELRPQVEAKGLKLTVDAPAQLPWISVDRLQVERVLSNLVVNALQHTKSGEINISAEERDNYLADFRPRHG